MEQRIEDLMTPFPKAIDADRPLIEAAAVMRDADVGDVIVLAGGTLHGIVTDRDIAVRAVAAGLDPSKTKVGDICTTNIAVLSPDDTLADAVRLMREHDVRRLPVTVDGQPIGIVSLGDLAGKGASRSVLADISSAPPDKESANRRGPAVARHQLPPHDGSESAFECVNDWSWLEVHRALLGVWR